MWIEAIASTDKKDSVQLTYLKVTGDNNMDIPSCIIEMGKSTCARLWSPNKDSKNIQRFSFSLENETMWLWSTKHYCKVNSFKSIPTDIKNSSK